jgi:hypothetical protein
MVGQQLVQGMVGGGGHGALMAVKGNQRMATDGVDTGGTQRTDRGYDE